MSKLQNPKEGFTFSENTIISEKEQKQKSQAFYDSMNERRSLRHFSDKKIDDKVIENIIKTASTAPSGAHKQPWFFAVVNSTEMKRKIRVAAEKEEYENYHGRMSKDWLKDLRKFGTDWEKPFLEIASTLIVVFKKTYDLEKDGKSKNYYVNESVGIATGLLIAAIHQSGLVSLTHTPSPLNFLSKLLNRPENEKPYLLIPIGYPAENAQVPILKRKELNEIMKTY